MIHLIVREPLAYQRTLSQALNNSFKGAFVAWFAVDATPDDRGSCEGFSHRFLPEAGFRRLFRELRTDSQATVILGGWSSPFAYKTLLICALLRVPVFVWTDHPHPRKRSWLFERLRTSYLRFLSRRVAGLLACGQPTVKHLESLRLPADKITNFPCWVDLPREWSLPKRCNEEGNASLRLIAIGRLVPVKAFEVAIEAVALANRKAGRNIAVLDLIGEGKERQHLEDWARSLELEDLITFSGCLSNEEVSLRLRAADALVVTSRFEGYGVVVLEALANARPVLASNGVIAAIDRDDGTGAIFFHAPSDTECLAQQIKLLAADKNSLRKSSEAARAIAEQWRPERAASILSKLLASNAKSNLILTRQSESMDAG